MGQTMDNGMDNTIEKLVDIDRNLTIGDVTTGVPSCTLSKTTCETFLRDALLNRQMRVEIWAAEPRKQNVWNIIKRVSVFLPVRRRNGACGSN